MPFVTAIVAIETPEGVRIDKALADGTYQTITLVLGSGLAYSSVQDGPATRVTIAVPAGAGVTGTAPVVVASGVVSVLAGQSAVAHDLAQRNANGVIANSRALLIDQNAFNPFVDTTATFIADDPSPATSATAEGIVYFVGSWRAWNGAASVVHNFRIIGLPGGGTGTSSVAIAGDLGGGNGVLLQIDVDGNLGVTGLVTPGNAAPAIGQTGVSNQVGYEGRPTFATALGPQVGAALAETAVAGAPVTGDFTFAVRKKFTVNTGGGAVIGTLPRANTVPAYTTTGVQLIGGNVCTFAKAWAGDTIMNRYSGVAPVSALDQLVEFESNGVDSWYPRF